MSKHEGEQSRYSRRNLMIYLAVMEGAPASLATEGIDALMKDPEMNVKLREEITWEQFQDEAPQLKELLP